MDLHQGKAGRTAVLVGTVTNDIRFLDDAALKGLKVCSHGNACARRTRQQTNQTAPHNAHHPRGVLQPPSCRTRGWLVDMA